MHQRRVLVIAYQFPPMGGIGVQRSLKFAQYLPENGWDPVVATVQDGFSVTMDNDLLAKIPEGTIVHRVTDPLARVAGRLAGLGQEDPSLKLNSITESRGIRKQIPFVARLRSSAKRIKDLLCIPDESFLWSLCVAFAAPKWVRAYNIEAIYTTSSPNSSHLAGWLISKITGLPWIADFRDPWTNNFHFQATGFRRWLERQLESIVIENATALVFVTEGFRKMFAHAHPSARWKMHLIRNGVDKHEFPERVQVGSREAPSPLTFLYCGILYPKRSPAPFFRALHQALESGRLLRHQIRIEFVGVFDYPGKTENSDLVKSLGLTDVVHVVGYVTHREAIQRMTQADVLLLISDLDESAGDYIPGKLYEYLYAGRPILALIRAGEGSELVRVYEAGLVVEPHREQDIEDALVHMVQTFVDNWEAQDVASMRPLTREVQATQLANVLNQWTGVSQERKIDTGIGVND